METIDTKCPTTGKECDIRLAFTKVKMIQDVQLTGPEQLVSQAESRFEPAIAENFQELFSMGEALCTAETCGLNSLSTVITFRRTSIEQAKAEVIG